MKTALLLLALTAIGCSQGLTSVDSPRVYVDPAIPPDQAAAAMDMWRTGVGVNWIVVDDKQSADVTIALVTDGCGIVDGRMAVGYEDEGTTAANVCVGTDPSIVPGAIAHELGHVMHLHHIPDSEPALMNRVVNWDSVLTDADKAQFRSVWGALL